MAVDFELEGKRALITGSGQGVGRAIALMIGAAGAEVAVNDFFPDRAEAVSAEIRAAGGKAFAAPFDVTNYELVHDAFSGLDKIDILVNNAGNAGSEGWAGLDKFVDTTPEDWAKYLSVNLYGVMNCVHAALPSMIAAQWGRIVTIISDAARHGEAQMASYCAAKAGAAGFCRGIAHEVGRYGITVNNISLGTMRTPISAAMWDDPSQSEHQKAALANYVVRRPGEPEDPAWLIASLVSPHASWITGQTYPVNGGYTFAL
ncbi:MAG TPA: SDR family NAD(P)-dependent oxidoreductase [Acidimicrobiales bacterium]|nr:SDR family NAD(P)-dependent oxidoreductase [Acidimicrobiales bacterium]